MRGRQQDGTFRSPFDPLTWGGDFTEGNALHYTWSVFHDPAGLARMMGGREEFAKKLDSVFDTPPLFDDSYYGFPIHEIREMQVADMGNYAHGNQPIQHMIYLYNWSSRPSQAQFWVRQVMRRMYSATPDGYCGDEDNGQTSAWFVFSALGFYPVCPGSGEYALGSPLFGRVVLHFPAEPGLSGDGKKLTILARKNSTDNVFVSSVRLGCRRVDSGFVSRSSLLRGGRLVFRMSASPAD
jgi:predicted alpha-1,2-mannosidase